MLAVLYAIVQGGLNGLDNLRFRLGFRIGFKGFQMHFNNNISITYCLIEENEGILSLYKEDNIQV